MRIMLCNLYETILYKLYDMTYAIMFVHITHTHTHTHITERLSNFICDTIYFLYTR